MTADHKPPTAANFDFCGLDESRHCITCSDEALPARVIAVEAMLAQVEVSGQITEVDISLVDDVAIGQVLLIHGGVAIAHLGYAEEKR